MATLWNHITGKKPEPAEGKLYNPLGFRVGWQMRVNALDLEHLIFVVKEVREIKHHIGDKNFYYCDYIIEAQPVHGGPVQYRLRLVPVQNPQDKQTLDAILLRKIGACGYDKNFEDGLAYEVHNGVFKEGDAEYWRVNDVKNEWKAKVRAAADPTGAGTVLEKDIKTSAMTYWDYWRKTKEDDVEITEFYVVEKDDKTGYFEFWVGPKIDPQRINT
jgi:hypothetical protein